VVVVDDSEDNVELFAALIEEYGHRVRTALDGARALELLEDELPDLVFLDLELPDMEGFEVAVRMRTRFGTGFRIIAITGHSGAAVRGRAAESGIDSFATKPIGLTELEFLLDVPSRPPSGRVR
jgi:CheY-like chemotaxis protein